MARIRVRSTTPRAPKSKTAAGAAAAAAEMLPGEIRPAEAIETNARASRLLAAAIGKERERLSDRSRRLQDSDQPARLKTRSALIFPQDRLGLERIVGIRDIVQITFLRYRRRVPSVAFGFAASPRRRRTSAPVF